MGAASPIRVRLLLRPNLAHDRHELARPRKIGLLNLTGLLCLGGLAFANQGAFERLAALVHEFEATLSQIAVAVFLGIHLIC